MGRWKAAGLVKPLGTIVAGLAVAAALSSCAHNLGVDYVPRSPSDPRLQTPPGHSVAGYTTVDGGHVSLTGHAWVEGDSMVFQRSELQGRTDAMQRPAGIRVALARLTSVDLIETGKRSDK